MKENCPCGCDCDWKFFDREMMKDVDRSQELTIWLRYRCIICKHDYLAYETDPDGSGNPEYWETFERSYAVKPENGYKESGRMPTEESSGVTFILKG